MNATLIAMEAAALAAMEGDGIPVTTPAKTQKVVSRPVLPKVDPKQEIKDRKRKVCFTCEIYCPFRLKN
jgi:hypothetical protein